MGAGRSPAAERMRRYRRRRREGRFVVRVEVGTEVLHALVTGRWLSEDEAQDPDAVGKVLGRLAERWRQPRPRPRRPKGKRP